MTPVPPLLLARVQELAQTRPDDRAFTVSQRGETCTLTWLDLWECTVGYARYFAEREVVPGDVVLICHPLTASLYPAYLGAMLHGAIPGFIAFPSSKQDSSLYWKGHQALVERIDPALVVTYAENLQPLHASNPDVAVALNPGLDGITRSPEWSGELPAPEQIALLQHSSGTTGQKKGVALTFAQIARQAQALGDAIAIAPDDVITSWLPLYHDMGLIAAFLAPLHWGIETVSLDAFEWVERPQMLLEAMAQHRGTFTWLPNFAFNHLVRTKTGRETYQLGHVRAFFNESEPVKAETLDRFVATFAAHGVTRDQLRVSYGLAEAVFTVSATPPGREIAPISLDEAALARGVALIVEPGTGRTFVSNGPPLPGIEIRVVPGSDAAPAGHGFPVGELQVRGDYVFAGYHQDETSTTEVFDGSWCRTGDVGALIGGEVYVLGRIKDVVIHHGVNYFAHDLEALATEVQGVKRGRCVAVSVPDPEVGSDTIVMIVERDPEDLATDGEIERGVREAIAAQFPIVLGAVHLTDPGWMVKTTSGKVSRADNLAKLLAQGQAPTAASVSASPAPSSSVPGSTSEVVITTISTTFSVPEEWITRETVALDVEGWDSLGHTVLMLRLGRTLGREIPESIAACAEDVGQLVDLIDELLQSQQ